VSVPLTERKYEKVLLPSDGKPGVDNPTGRTVEMGVIPGPKEV
jgi:hypothetical protein